MSQDSGEAGGEEGFLLLSSKQSVDEELCWQFGPTSSLACSSQYIIVEKGANLQFTPATSRKRGGCSSRLADTEPEQHCRGHEEACGSLCCLHCEQKKLSDLPIRVVDPGAVGKARPLQNQHYKQQLRSFEDRDISFSKDSNRTSVMVRPERLGAALCLSQTRAQNAEKLASEALIEKEELTKLFFKEANTCHSYKKKLQLLELENLWLKTNLENNFSETCLELPTHFNTSTPRHCKFYRKGFSKDSSLAPGSVSLAFALGLSCASAGFVLGCCMGLIGLSH